MTHPSYAQFKKLCRKGNVVPVSVELPADLETPVSVFLKLASKLPHAFLLESVELGEKIGRFSLIGFDPHLVLEYRNGKGVILKGQRKKTLAKLDFLNLIESLLKRFRFVGDSQLPELISSKRPIKGETHHAPALAAKSVGWGRNRG